MTPAKPAQTKASAKPQTRRAPAPERITTDDLRHKALAIRDMTTDEARHVLERNRVRVVIATALTVAVVVSVAYYIGSRRGRAAARARR